MKLYLAYVNGMIKDKEATRVRLASVKAEEEEMLEEVEKSIRENLEEEAGEEDLTEEVGMGEQVGGEKNIDVNKEKVSDVKDEDSVKVRDRVGSFESGYGSGKVEVSQQTSL